MKTLKIITPLLICSSLYGMQKTVEITEKHKDIKTQDITISQKRLSIDELTKEDIKRLSQELEKIQEQEEVGTKGCKCTPNVMRNVVAGVGSGITTIASLVISVLTLLLRK